MTRHAILLLLITVWVCVVYSNSPHNDFHYDDYTNILENSNIKTLKGALIDVLGWNTPRVVSYFTLYLNYKLGIDKVELYRIFNISLHIINCALIYFIVLFTLHIIGDGRTYLAFLASLFFALHPINNEPLNYILHGRFMILCNMFYLLGLLLFISAFLPHLSSEKKIPCLVASSACYLLSVFSKEIGITLPAVLFSYYIYFIAKTRRAYIKASTFFAISLFLVAIYALWIDIPSIIKSHFPKGVSPIKILVVEMLEQLNSALLYLKLYILPSPAFLNVDHSVAFIPFYADLTPKVDMTTAIAIVVISGLLILTIVSYKYNRLFSFSLLYIFITHSPTSIVRRGEFIAEYKNYLPLFGFCLVAAIVVDKLCYFTRLGKSGAIALVLVTAALFSVVDYQRNWIWENDFTLWGDAVSKPPVSPRAYNNFGLAYMAIGGSLKAEGKLHEYDEYLRQAIFYFNTALEVNPEYLESIHNVGVAYYYESDYDKALEYAKKYLQYDKDSEKSYRLMGCVYRGKGDLEKALYYYEQAYKLAQGQIIKEQNLQAINDLKEKIEKSRQK